jgi:hypothetical protein
MGAACDVCNGNVRADDPKCPGCGGGDEFAVVEVIYDSEDATTGEGEEVSFVDSIDAGNGNDSSPAEDGAEPAID